VAQFWNFSAGPYQGITGTVRIETKMDINDSLILSIHLKKFAQVSSQMSRRGHSRPWSLDRVSYCFAHVRRLPCFFHTHSQTVDLGLRQLRELAFSGQIGKL
jgi:hypothetical protein